MTQKCIEGYNIPVGEDTCEHGHAIHQVQEPAEGATAAPLTLLSNFKILYKVLRFKYT